MKKTKTLLLACSVAAIFLTGCPKEPVIENKWGRDPVDLSSAKSTDLVKINIKDAKGFGTIWGGNAATTKAQARAAAGENNGSNTLITFKADGSTDYALTKPEGLASWCEYQPVREVYQCPYTNVEKQAKGIYVVFSSYIDFWEDEAGNKLAPIGQLMYVKPDGTVVDVFGSINKPKTILDTTIKENDDWDYIKFDRQGNIYMIVKDEGTSKICRYNPQNNNVSFYNIPGEKIYPLNFELTADGSYIILNTLVNYEGIKNIKVRGPQGNGEKDDVTTTGENYVYAISVNSDTVKELYKPVTTNRGREVENVCYDSKNNKVYFGVYSIYASGVGSGIHVWERNTAGDFVNEKVFFSPEDYFWRKKELTDLNYTAKYEELKNAENGASDFLAFLKSFYGPNADKVHFTLDFFRNYENAVVWGDKTESDMVALDVDNLEETTKYCFFYDWNPYNTLYKTGEDGKVLTDEAAMKYLWETKNSLSIKNNDEASKDKSIWDYDIDILINWQVICWNGVQDENGNRDYTMKTALYLFFTTATDGTWSPETAAYPGYYDITDANQRAQAKAWCLSSHRNLCDSTLIANDDGIWVFDDGCDDWGTTGWQEDYSYLNKIFDTNGNTVNVDTPDSVKPVQGYRLPHQWKLGDIRNRVESDPWYKAPFKAFTDSFLLKDRNNNTIWYYNCANDTCSKIFNDSSLSIYSYSLNNGVLTVNGNTDLGYNRTVKVTVSTGAQTEIDCDAKFETLIDVNIPEE